MARLSYAAMLAQLYRRTAYGIKPGLSSMQVALARLGNPHERMRHVVIAGTNGKGSTSAIIACTLAASGVRVGHYTSPHLLRFSERIRITGREAAPATLTDLYERVLAVDGVGTRPLTFFEVTTAMALCAFADAAVDVAVLEVGMGGRLDATNVVSKEASVITRIDLDHQQWLGDSLEAIAAEKAGIIAPERPVVMAAQHPGVAAVIAGVARTRRAELIVAPQPGVRDDTLTLTGGNLLEAQHFSTWPRAAYQRENIAAAAAAVEALRSREITCAPAALRAALASFDWQGRYQWLQDRVDILLDGAHNPAAIGALLGAIAEDPRAASRPKHVVATVLQDRDPRAMLDPLRKLARTVHLCPVGSRRTRTVEDLRDVGSGTTVHPSFVSAVDAAIRAASRERGYVLVTGSLFLVGDALAYFTGAPRDPSFDG